MTLNSDQIQENIDFWSLSEPKAAIMLPYVNCNDLTFCRTAAGELNLKDESKGIPSFVYSLEDAHLESKRWFDNIDLSNTDLLYIYGVGLGYGYEAALSWLQQSEQHFLFFLEDDLRVIYRLLETELGSKIVRESRVKLFYFEKLEEISSPLTEIYWLTMSIKMKVSALPYYAQHKVETLQKLDHKLYYDATLRHSIVDEYLTYGVAFFRNFYPNILSLPGASLGDSLVGSFQGVPAIICGAGPSLTQHADLLAKLGDRALIFAGGSATNALNAAGVQPHLGAGIDPNPEQYKRLESNFAFEVPYLYRNRMYDKACRAIHGPHIYITGSGGFDVSQWFEEQLDILQEEVDEGFNVINFCLDVARLWGCNPIVFVGMDLAYTDLQAYALGVVENAAIDLDAFLNNADIDLRPLIQKDIHGLPTYTLWKWISESKWISNFAEEHPELTLINATEAGIGFEGVPNIDLETTVDTHLSQQYDFSSRLHGEIQSHLLTQVTRERVVKAMEELRESLNRCCQYLTIMHDETSLMLGKIKTEKRLPASLQSGMAALAEIELADEIGYRHVLEVFNIVFSKKVSYEVRQLRLDALPEFEQAAQKWAINNRRLSFLRDVAKANIALIQHSIDNTVY